MLEHEPIDPGRKKPVQLRSQQTVSLILEAAGQLLRSPGEKAFTTSAVATRAGISIGTLYQYFQDGDAILLALADQERRKVGESMRTLVRHPELANSLEPTRVFLRAVIASFAGRRGAGRQSELVSSAKREKGIEHLRVEFSDVLASLWSATGRSPDAEDNRVRAYVLTRAIVGVLHPACLESSLVLCRSGLDEMLCQIVLALEPPGFRNETD